ncbi:hypothetical protein LTS18_001262 [Coniosporium uncinatum]|uniref:Uncharacterized protein n=1 Tax=Coniosporium uncinatum TaxID=93489 RepID=A0ACC3CTL3_9PEZI|nr:hypothetical protein LTS18_001262 [Coniosporium uncinatum]
MAALDQDSGPYASFKGMPTSRDTPNPLRPYYIPPSIGPEPTSTSNGSAPSSSRPAFSSSSSKPKASFGSSARDILSDLDYGDYLPDSSPSAAEMAKKLMDQALWNYTSVLLAQPFEVAKTVLQVRLVDAQATLDKQYSHSRSTSRQSNHMEPRYQDVCLGRVS